MLHMSMFVTTIREQASDEQKAYWMPKIEKYEIIGAYAQTELGHGSNVKGIELQAKYDPKAKEFTLHSPTLTASKWWNGTLGRTATHSIVVAQLLLPRQTTASANEIEYVNYGPHPFMVQIRDQKTHMPFAGIAVGDIGAKYGYPGMDNAYMLFNNFKIPHSAFLSRYAKVNGETGAYTKPENPAVIYGSLTATRANIVMHARLVLARACTVAVRYLSIRRQFRDRDADGAGPEVAVLDYPTVQIRILPLLATTFALHYSGQAMKQLFEDTRKGISGGDFSKLADLHSMSSGLKSLCTTLAADGIEASRRALGGHGFGGGSGLIQLNNDYLSKPTVEGDNWMITQQTAAYIIKKATAAIKAPDANATDDTDRNLKEYLRNSRYSDKGNKFDVLSNDQAIVNAFKRRAAHLSFKAQEERIVKKRSWNSLLIQLHKLSHAHSQSILIENFYTGITLNKTVPPGARTVLLHLFRLFSLYTLDANGREFFNSGAVSNEQLDQLPERIQDLMTKIRPHAVNLVDSWMIPDYLLDSALGRSDGKVYEDLFNRAHRLNPLNEQTFNPYYWTDEIVMGSNDGKEILAKL
jgi:acyl-CoA oxidase